jgi:imidazolonepropionase-like amidohydrolase
MRLAWQEGVAALDELAVRVPLAGAKGGPGLALMAAKVLTCELEGPGYIDRGVVLVEDGRITGVGRRGEVEIPVGFEVVDVGANWLMPGMIDLHSHVTGSDPRVEINEAVLLANPGLRVSAAIIPGSAEMRRGLRAGVTTMLFLPGSATTIGGQGTLMKTAPGTFAERVVRSPGSLKIAQYGNPDRWGPGVGKTLLNHTLRTSLDSGRGYWLAWKAFERGEGPEPVVDPDLEVFRELFDHEIPCSVHTQVLQVVLATIDILRIQHGLEVFLAHGTFDAWRIAAYAWQHQVNAILGPRTISNPDRSMIDWTGDNPERVQGHAAGYQEAGHGMIGFNTDSPAVPAHELPIQAAVAVRHGFVDDRMQAVRGLTIVPAMTIGFGHRLGSLEPGKDADIVVISGHPADPRSKVHEVYVDGERVHDADEAPAQKP